MTLVTISADQEIFEVGAHVIGILAFPSDRQKADAAATAWCAEYVQAHSKLFPETAKDVLDKYPEYAPLRPWEIRRGLRSAKTQLRYRSVAARMSRGFFYEDVFSRPAQLPNGMARLSLRQLGILVKRESRQHDPDNTKKRIWRSSRKIIHLAAAFDQEVDADASNDNGVRIDDYDLMARVLRRAEWHEQFVLKDDRFGVSSDDLIRVRVA